MTKTPWYDIEPKDAVDISLPNDTVQGPYNELGEECPWPWEPQQLVGAPMGQYHCSYCMGMNVAGVPHMDHGPMDEKGLNDADYSYTGYIRNEMIAEGASLEETERKLGPITDRERKMAELEGRTYLWSI